MASVSPGVVTTNAAVASQNAARAAEKRRTEDKKELDSMAEGAFTKIKDYLAKQKTFGETAHERAILEFMKPVKRGKSE